ncbi:hypothetical protein [Nioella sp.]|uniref:hypothetical protein n=1 Tax=Nioella sp. TaxID=1912091 RepID=UPI00351773EA
MLGIFAETGAPQAGAEAQNYARQLEEQARAALAAAEAELAVQEARLASVSAFPDAARVNPAYGQIAGDVDAATARVAELRATLDGARRTLDALNRSAISAGASSGDFSEVVTTVNVNTVDLADTLEDLNIGLGRVPANVESGATALDKMKEAARQTQSEVAGMAQGLGRFLMQVAKGADAARQAIANLLSRAAEILLNRGLMSLLGGMNLSGGLGSVLSGLFGNGLSLTGSTAALTTAAGMASASTLMPATGGLGASAAGSSVNINVNVDGANGDQHVMDLVAQGVQTGLSRFDRVLPGRVREIQSNPRRR